MASHDDLRERLEDAQQRRDDAREELHRIRRKLRWLSIAGRLLPWAAMVGFGITAGVQVEQENWPLAVLGGLAAVGFAVVLWRDWDFFAQATKRQ